MKVPENSTVNLLYKEGPFEVIELGNIPGQYGTILVKDKTVGKAREAYHAFPFSHGDKVSMATEIMSSVTYSREIIANNRNAQLATGLAKLAQKVGIGGVKDEFFSEEECDLLEIGCNMIFEAKKVRMKVV